MDIEAEEEEDLLRHIRFIAQALRDDDRWRHHARAFISLLGHDIDALQQKEEEECEAILSKHLSLPKDTPATPVVKSADIHTPNAVGISKAEILALEALLDLVQDSETHECKIIDTGDPATYARRVGRVIDIAQGTVGSLKRRHRMVS